MEIQEWTLILTAIGILIAFCALVIGYYSKVHIHKRKEKEQKREEIYKPLLSNITLIIEGIKKRDGYVPDFWESLEGKVSPKLYEKLKIFHNSADDYFKLLKHNQDFIRYKIYFYWNYHLPDLEKECNGLGLGNSEYNLYTSIVTPILNGEIVTLDWIKNNKKDFYKRLLQCPHYEKLEELLKWLKDENPCIQSLGKAEQELLQSAEKLKLELEKF